MVNHSTRMDRLFGALGSATRRNILAQLAADDGRSVTELSAPLRMKLPALLKQLDVLEAAHLITREKTGRTVHVRLSARPMSEAIAWLQRYERFWPKRIDRLAAVAERIERQAAKGGA